MILANARQYAAVKGAVFALKNALNALKTLTRDMAGLDLEEALGALCEADRTTGIRTGSQHDIRALLRRKVAV